jgi:hypothetical protein
MSFHVVHSESWCDTWPGTIQSDLLLMQTAHSLFLKLFQVHFAVSFSTNKEINIFSNFVSK